MAFDSEPCPVGITPALADLALGEHPVLTDGEVVELIVHPATVAAVAFERPSNFRVVDAPTLASAQLGTSRAQEHT
jgi:hypothetical protein